MELDHVYRAVVALNNLGVSLLEQARYPQAHATLVDAMTLLKPAFRPLIAVADDTTSAKEDSCPSQLDVDKVMLRANQRYARVMFVNPSTAKIQVAVLSSRADALDLEAAIGGRSSSCCPVLHPVRLEPNDHEACHGCNHHNGPQEEKQEAFITCFAILHNCSIATLLLKDLENEPMSSILKPFKMLGTCQRVLLGLGYNVSDNQQLRQHMYLDFVAHKTLIDMLCITGQREEAHSLAATLQHLRFGMEQHVHFDLFTSTTSTAMAFAPAA